MLETKTDFDPINQQILAQRIKRRDRQPGPRIGDYIQFPSGKLEMITHVGESFYETSSEENAYLANDGKCWFDGESSTTIDKQPLKQLSEKKEGEFWFYHHECFFSEFAPTERKKVRVKVPCFVYGMRSEPDQ